ncbi:MAG: T9SS type A sorting domain-containing protein [Bacteroidales bacterium]
MRKILFFMVVWALFLISISLKAQVSLPYYSGFDDASQKAGWTEYKKAATTFSHWGYASSGAYSAPNCVGHDYSPSTGITLTDNWFVSPAFSISNGGKLDSIRYGCSGYSQPEAGDTVAIYLLNGSQDPDLATSKLLLFDIRGDEYVNDYTFHLKANIDLPSYSGLSYIAIRYRNTDCSSKWLSVGFDNIAISGNNSGLNDLETNSTIINLYPNPANDKATLEIKGLTKAADIIVYDINGRKVKQYNLNAGQRELEIDVNDLAKGVYEIKIISDKDSVAKKLIVN